MSEISHIYNEMLFNSKEKLNYGIQRQRELEIIMLN